MRRGGRRTTRRSTGNQNNLSNRENSNSAAPNAEFPNFGMNLHPNMAEGGSNSNRTQVSNQLNGIGSNLGVSSEVSVNVIPSQIPGNSEGAIQSPRSSMLSPTMQQRQESQVGAIQSPRSSILSSTIQQRQESQEGAHSSISMSGTMSNVNNSFSMGSMSLLTNIGTINPFKGAPTENIQEWITQFNWIADINHWSEDVRCALLPGHLEDVAKTWYSTLSMRDRGNYQVIQTKLLQAFQQVISPVQHLNQLLARTQSEQEPVETYAYNKLKLCEDLNKEMAEIDKVTYLIQGMKPQLRSYLLDKKPNTVSQAIQFAREKQNNINLNMDLRSSPHLAMSTNINHQLSASSISPVNPTTVRLMTGETINQTPDLGETLSQIRQLQEGLKEVNKSQLEVMRRLETTQNTSTTYNNERAPLQPYSAQRVNQWTDEGRPICRKCSKIGHIARNCRQNQPYQRPSSDKFNKYHHSSDRQGKRQWTPSYSSSQRVSTSYPHSAQQQTLSTQASQKNFQSTEQTQINQI